MSLLFSLFSTFRGGLSTAILFYRFNLVISRKFIRSHWLLAPEIISQERKERKKEKERKKNFAISLLSKWTQGRFKTAWYRSFSLGQWFGGESKPFQDS